jgi:hypothetical protein
MIMLNRLFVYIDESGNFDFSPKGTAYYTFTALMTYLPLKYLTEINQLQLAILSGDVLPGLSAEYLDKVVSKQFHATEDKQPVRDLFFGLIGGMDNFWVNSIVIRKNRTHPSLRVPAKFYSKFLGSLMSYVFQAYRFSSLCIFVDGCAVEKNKDTFKKSVIGELHKRDPEIKFNIYFPPSASYGSLQIVDYINWAIYRKWDGGDLRSYELIKKYLKSPERDIFQNGDTDFY